LLSGSRVISLQWVRCPSRSDAREASRTKSSRAHLGAGCKRVRSLLAETLVARGPPQWGFGRRHNGRPQPV
jgi:hypothetical protein